MNDQGVVKWVRPLSWCYKVNVDGAVFSKGIWSAWAWLSEMMQDR